MIIECDPVKRLWTIEERGLDMADAGLMSPLTIFGIAMVKIAISPLDIWRTEWLFSFGHDVTIEFG